MTFEEYQKRAKETAAYPKVGGSYACPVESDKLFYGVYPVMGLCGEAGEVAEKVKKIFRDDGGVLTEERKEMLKKELGDVLWYLSQVALELGLSLEEVAEFNLEKLASRKEREKIMGDGDNR